MAQGFPRATVWRGGGCNPRGGGTLDGLTPRRIYGTRGHMRTHKNGQLYTTVLERIRGYARKTVRSFGRRDRATCHTAVGRGVAWLLPWRYHSYPPLETLAVELFGTSISTLNRWRSDPGRVPPTASLTLAAAIRAECAAGLVIAAELESAAVEKQARRRRAVKTGYHVVAVDAGGVARDSRPRHGRKKI